MATEEDAAFEDDGRADDLIGRDVEVHPRTPHLPLEIVSSNSSHARRVQPTVQANRRQIDISTDDLRVLAPSHLASIVLEPSFGEVQYGFRLEYRPPGEQAWEPLPPIRGQADAAEGWPNEWHWQRVHLNPLGGGIAVGGVASRFEDRHLGFSYDWEVRPSQQIWLDQGHGEFRVLVIPLWDRWRWDKTGYSTWIAASFID